MCYIIAPPEIMEMERKIRPYRINALKLKDDTPEEIREMDRKVDEFYRKETEGYQ